MNYLFAAIFTVEAGLKIFVFRSEYFKNKWNNFDFLIVIGTYFGIIVTATTDSNVGAAALLIRSFRLLRIVRLLKRAKSLRVIFNTLIVTIPSLANVGGLLLLLLFIYAILGVQLFAKVKL